jgi:proliferating cell nuclear antigen PCNA
MAHRAYTFKAKTVEAYTVKSLAEVLQNILTDVCFTFDKDGIKLLTVDNKRPSHLLVSLLMDGEAFDEYYCPKTLNVGINLQHLYRLLKSIKKKDKIELFIEKNNPAVLGIRTIQADSGQPVGSSIKIQKLSQIDTMISDEYDHPIHIPTSTYQKMCKDIQSMSSKIDVYSKGTYLKFSCNVEGMYEREVPFGDFDEESLDDEYSDTFYTKSLSQLIKVSGLNSRMQVYTPPANSTMDLPLKISINTGQLGTLKIYIKSVEQIDVELSDY